MRREFVSFLSQPNLVHVTLVCATGQGQRGLWGRDWYLAHTPLLPYGAVAREPRDRVKQLLNKTSSTI